MHPTTTTNALHGLTHFYPLSPLSPRTPVLSTKLTRQIGRDTNPPHRASPQRPRSFASAASISIDSTSDYGSDNEVDNYNDTLNANQKDNRQINDGNLQFGNGGDDDDDENDYEEDDEELAWMLGRHIDRSNPPLDEPLARSDFSHSRVSANANMSGISDDAAVLTRVQSMASVIVVPGVEEISYSEGMDESVAQSPSSAMHEGLLSAVLLHSLIQIAEPWKVTDILFDSFALCSTQGHAYELYCELLDKELALFSSDSDSKLALLYPTSNVCKLMYAFHRFFSFHFLPSLLLDIMKYVMNRPLSYQLHSHPKAETKDDLQIANISNAITDILQRLHQAIMGLSPSCQAAFVATQERFKSKFDDEAATDAGIVFTINALIIPAILNPHVYGLSLEAPNATQAQSLSFLANTIVQISRGIEFTTWPWVQLNDFVMRQGAILRGFIPSNSYVECRELDKWLKQSLPIETNRTAHISNLCVEVQENYEKIIKLTPHLIVLIEALNAHKLLRISKEKLTRLRKVFSGPPDVTDLTGISPKSHPGKQLILFPKSHHKCFPGSEVVDWLIVNLSHFASIEINRRRGAATELGAKLLEYGIICNVDSHSNRFRDDDCLFRFSDDDVKKGLNNKMTWKSSPGDPLEVVGNLLDQIINLYDSYTMAYGDATDSFLLTMRNTPAYREFSLATAALQKVNLAYLSEKERLCFFINVYNTLSLHGFVELPASPTGLRRISFYKQATYVIEGHLYSLLDIEQSILRGNSGNTAYVGVIGGGSAKRIGRNDPRYANIVQIPCSFLPFALWSGTRSGPRVVSYDLECLFRQMESVSKHYIEKNTVVDQTQGEVLFPKIFDYYLEDFGGSRFGLCQAILRMRSLSQQLKTDVVQALQSRGERGIGYREYDATFEYDNEPDQHLQLTQTQNYHRVWLVMDDSHGLETPSSRRTSQTKTSAELLTETEET